jgi:hypothetical protein
LASGFELQPESQYGHPVNEDLLIMALAAICGSKGASPDVWKAMKFVPQEFAAVHCGVAPVSVVLLEITEGSTTKVLPVTEMSRASHWQPSQYEIPSGAIGSEGRAVEVAYSWHVPAFVTVAPAATELVIAGVTSTAQSLA